jgi:hypothetical protein
MTMTDCTCDEVVDDAWKPAADTIPFDIDITDYCATHWQPNRTYEQDAFARPRTPNGFAIQAQNAGVSGPIEPPWRAVLNGTQRDGSILWKYVAAAGHGINPATAPTAEVDSVEAGALTVDGLDVVDGHRLIGLYKPSTAGVYVVTFAFTVDGVPRGFSQKVTVT